jgi:hypothetical protein
MPFLGVVGLDFFCFGLIFPVFSDTPQRSAGNEDK